MRREVEAAGRLEDWLGCWEEWEVWEEVRGREVVRGRRLAGKGGERVERRNEYTLLERRDCMALALWNFQVLRPHVLSQLWH